MTDKIPQDVIKAVHKIAKDELALINLLHGLIQYHPMVKTEANRYPAIVEHIECVLGVHEELIRKMLDHFTAEMAAVVKTTKG